MNLAAVRYLNVHEAIGSLSLAVAPHAIHAVQRIALPLREFALPVSQSDNKLVENVRDAAQRMRATASKLRVAPMERRKMELGVLPDPTGAAKRYSEARRSCRRAEELLEKHLEEQYLAGTCDLVRRAVTQAASHWRDDDIETYVTIYRTLAALLEKRDLVRSAVSAQPWPQVTAD